MTLENPSNLATNRFLSIWWALLFVKLFAGALLPMTADEAYYWTWTHHLDFSYFDHPPMVAWFLALGKPFEFLGQAVRWPAIFLGHLVPLIWWQILRKKMDSQKTFFWLILFFLCPMTGMGGIVVTPDLPLLLFWSLALFSFFKCLESSSWKNPALLGFWLGLGFCSKYHIVLLPLSLLPLLSFKDFRQRFPLRFFPVVFLVGALSCLPVLSWNYQHDFISFVFQIRHGLSEPTFEARWPIEYVTGELLLLFPLVVWAALRRPRLREEWVFAATAVVPLGFFFLTSFKASTELNWPLMAYPSVFALACLRIGKKSLWAAGIFWGAIQLAALTAVLFPVQFPLHGKLTEPQKIRELTSLTEEGPPLFTTTYQLASSIWYNSKKPVYKLAGVNRFDMFDLWPESEPKTDFRLLQEKEQDLPGRFPAGWKVTRLPDPAPGFELFDVRRP